MKTMRYFVTIIDQYGAIKSTNNYAITMNHYYNLQSGKGKSRFTGEFSD
jgi:hypothetical protein